MMFLVFYIDVIELVVSGLFVCFAVLLGFVIFMRLLVIF